MLADFGDTVSSRLQFLRLKTNLEKCKREDLLYKILG